MHKKLHVPHQENPTSPFLTPYAARLLLLVPLLALGTLDDEGRPWTTLLGGEAGFARPLGQSVMGIRNLVDPKFDPVIDRLLSNHDIGESEGQKNKHRAVAALGIDLATRSRVKLAGDMVAGALDQLGGNDSAKDHEKATEAQMLIKIDRSLGMQAY